MIVSNSVDFCRLGGWPFVLSLISYGIGCLESWVYIGAVPKAVVELFHANMWGSLNNKCKTLWRMVVPGVLWSVWLERNKRLFENTRESCEEV